MEELDFESLPASIRTIVNGLPYICDNVGKSNSKVYLFEDYVLKITSLSFDIDNEYRVYKQLYGKLPIAKIIAYEEIDGKVFVLKQKLKGKMLCDEYYLARPELLFTLAAKAIKLLWNVDAGNLDLQDTRRTVLEFGKSIKDEYLSIENCDKNITSEFISIDDIFTYLYKNQPKLDKSLIHGDLCLPNIICDGDKIVGFVDMGLCGISDRYHDLAILYRSIKYNFDGHYGKSYPGFEENKLFDIIGIKKNEEKIKYYLLLDEVLG